MKKLFAVLCILLVVSVVFNITQAINKQKISNHISNYIIANTQQLSDLYENMYSGDEPNEYFEFSLAYADDICDKIEEEVVFYNTIYPKRDMLLSYLVDDYKLLIRVMKNKSNLIKEAQILHSQLQQYFLEYVNSDIKHNNNPGKELWETDKKIKTNDNGNWHLLHDEIVRLSKK